MRIVLSGVNLVDMGPLTVFRDALSSLVRYSDQAIDIVALVHRSSLLNVPGVRYLEFPRVKGSWLRRLRFEYHDCLGLSRQLRPDIWLAMHDMTPRVETKRQFAYCHNPSPFAAFSMKEAMNSPKFGLFMLFYRYLYGIGISRNEAVIVQQDWIRDEFRRRYRPRSLIVAHPRAGSEKISRAEPSKGDPYRFFYPAYPRIFKNHELLLEAVCRLESRGRQKFEVLLTVAPEISRHAKQLHRRYRKLESVRWLGLKSHEEVRRLYCETDCLVFPSKLETWGLPLTEWMPTGKPMLAADLSYAHESVGTYDRCEFFAAGDPEDLARKMEATMEGSIAWRKTIAAPIAEPFAASWDALWPLLFEMPEHHRR